MCNKEYSINQQWADNENSYRAIYKYMFFYL